MEKYQGKIPRVSYFGGVEGGTIGLGNKKCKPNFYYQMWIGYKKRRNP